MLAKLFAERFPTELAKLSERARALATRKHKHASLHLAGALWCFSPMSASAYELGAFRSDS